MGDRDADGFPIATAQNDGSVYVDEFEVAWVCEFEPSLDDYVWRTLGPLHGRATD